MGLASVSALPYGSRPEGDQGRKEAEAGRLDGGFSGSSGGITRHLFGNDHTGYCR